MQVLTEEKWHQQSRELKKRIDNLLKNYFSNRSKSTKHPVIDFLFEYYSFRFSELKSWSPGIGVILTGDSASDLLKNHLYKKHNDGVTLDISKISPQRKNTISWIIDLLQQTKERSPYLGCLGLHEWAMVYGQQKTRHNLPLRMSPQQIMNFVENSRIRCTHYDAFRFFTKPAKPLNELNPTKQTRRDFEQPGCLHANMDLYKWAHKFYPWIASDIIADAFELAWRIREVDMRASPYDMSVMGYEPICIETPEGRQQYTHLQRQFFTEAQPLREKLIVAYQNIQQMLT
ncbi:3-methyladenine DNA glycosylase [Candidatus Uabimicrobium amorphum]|uniref:3-methyladenine DNA glycosylase n=1 Tax=Uabimicrobium amorphum TaxID=2596890 RepID=A0A5S9IHL3_UABAM|nr:3-methyladenine DNA glycosylase [Candidatus Uabimicrobium amorphum]BBM81700.1 hypothetical protein UABAM_00039 [Candidatus Uabimicrobium amorphum]